MLVGVVRRELRGTQTLIKITRDNVKVQKDILQVTPTDTAAALTQVSSAVPRSPDRYYESLSSNHRTFARVVSQSLIWILKSNGEVNVRPGRNDVSR